MDITLVGRRVTVVVNGTPVIIDQVIPGLTGSALDSDEGAPGPIVLQGEEQLVEFRNVTISVPDTTVGAGNARSSCATNDADAIAAVRARLNEWVRQNNAGDVRGAAEVWSRELKGWFPSAPVFSDSAAAVAAGVPFDRQRALPRSEYSIVIDDIAGGTNTVAVHDIWTERKTFSAPSRTVERTIRGSELWRCQDDGRWRIARYVSAPEPWRRVGE